MNILYLLVPVTLILAAAAVAAFVWAVRHGQFDDVHSPAVRMLLDDEEQIEQMEDNDERRQGN